MTKRLNLQKVILTFFFGIHSQWELMNQETSFILLEVYNNFSKLCNFFNINVFHFKKILW